MSLVYGAHNRTTLCRIRSHILKRSFTTSKSSIGYPRALLLQNRFTALNCRITSANRTATSTAPSPALRTSQYRQKKTMASSIPHNKDPSTLHFSPTTTGVASLPGITEESRKTVTELLQKNHDEHYIFFNKEGFHNHLVHELLAKYALGATPELLRASYQNNADYQRPLPKADESIVSELRNGQASLEVWNKYLFQRERYAEFLAFFKSEIEQHGMENTIKKFLFAGTEVSESMLARLLAGFVHPYIHLGYALEFKSPPIAAEALAQTAAHDDWIGTDFLFPAEQAAKKEKESNGTKKPVAFLSLLHDVHNDEDLRTAALWSDSNKIEGLLSRQREKIVAIAAKVRVNPETLEQQTTESINMAATLCAGSIRPDKVIAFDFFLMHSNNSSLFCTVFNQQDWIPTEVKVRLLEWKVRYDLILYASRRAPKLYIDEVRNYTGPFSETYYKYLEKSKPAKGRLEVPVANPWLALIEEALKIKDDGHSIKMVRAIMHAEEVCKGFTQDGDGYLDTPEMFRNYAGMVVDSAVRADGDSIWVRSTGFDEAWEGVPDRGDNKGNLSGAYKRGET